MFCKCRKYAKDKLVFETLTVQVKRSVYYASHVPETDHAPYFADCKMILKGAILNWALNLRPGRLE